MNRLFLLVTLLLAPVVLRAQDVSYARQLIDTLTSPAFWGRGYTKDGMKKAAKYIEGEMQRLQLQPLNGKDFQQTFSMPVNAFPGKMELVVNEKKLIPGIDYIVHPASPSVNAKSVLKQVDSVTFSNDKYQVSFISKDKLTWSVAHEQKPGAVVYINRKNVMLPLHSFKLKAKAELLSSFQASNVCGMVKGTLRPDSFIVFTAHYDHLGGMGKQVYFPGANDNASGTSMMLSLAKYFAKNPQRYSIAFIAFAAEEAGLLGSKYFTENSLIALTHIRFLTNLDLVGTGEEGMMVVNATEFPKHFSLLKQLNDDGRLISTIKQRGKAANSDHYWFSEKGVPSFFIYTMGGTTAYHDVNDRATSLPLTAFIPLFQLLVKFTVSLQQ